MGGEKEAEESRREACEDGAGIDVNGIDVQL